MRVIGKGSLIRRNKLDRSHCRDWQMRVYTEDASGHRKVNTRPFHGTWSQGQRALDAFRAELAAAGEHDADMTFAEYRAEFDAWEKSSGKAEDTLDKHRHALNALSMHLGSMKLRDLRPVDIENAYAAMRRGDTPSGRPYTETTLSTYHAVGHMLLKRAVRDGIVESNPFDRIDTPTPDTGEKKALTVDGAAELLSKLDAANHDECLAILALTMGLRRGECSRIRRSHVGDGILAIPKAKTKAGIRTLPMPAPAQHAIAVRLAAQDAEFAARGMVPHDDELLCATPLHRTMKPSSLTHWWERNCSRFGMDGWTLHELRHTFLTLLAESGATPRVMQELAGHESPVTTLKIYTHVHDEQKRSAMEAFGGLFTVDSGSGDPSVTHEGGENETGQEA